MLYFPASLLKTFFRGIRWILPVILLSLAGAKNVWAAELLQNGAFDDGALEQSWTLYTEHAKIAGAVDPMIGHLAPGAYHISLESHEGGNGCLYQGLATTPGRKYEISGWAMGRNLKDAGVKVGLRVEYRNSERKFISWEPVKILDSDTPDGEWREAALTITVPAGASRMNISGYFEFSHYPETAPTPEIFFDDFSVKGGERVDYGASLPADRALGLWWCDNMRKVMRDQPVPKNTASGVVIEAARNEYEPFQVCLKPSEELRGVRFEAEGLPKGVSVEIFREEYVSVTMKDDEGTELGEYPDPLLPAERSANLAAGQNQPFWFDVRVDTDAEEGEHEFTLKLFHEGGTPVSIPVRLRVFPFALPQTTSVRTAFGVDVWPQWHGELDSDGLKTVWKKYLTTLTDHRISPCIIFTYESFPWRPEVARVSPEGDVACDFTAFDEISRFLFDEHHANSFTRPFASLPKGLRNWISEQPRDQKLVKRAVESYQSALVRHIREQGWQGKYYNYFSDEPPVEDYSKLQTALKEEKELLPDLPLLVAFNGSPTPNKSFAGLVDVWVPTLACLDQWQAHEARCRGDSVWFYVAGAGKPGYPNLIVTEPAASHRALFWMVKRFNLDGFLYWNTDWWKFTNPWKETMTKDVKSTAPVYREVLYANTDGVLLYPPTREQPNSPVLAGPIPSIRLKMIREGLEDTEYLTLLGQRVTERNPALELPGALIPGATSFAGALSYDSNPEHYFQARHELAEAIIKAGCTHE